MIFEIPRFRLGDFLWQEVSPLRCKIRSQGIEIMDIEKVIFSLFQEAQKKSGVQYLFALVRVSSIEVYEVDPLIVFQERVYSGEITRQEITSSEVFWALVTN